MGRLRVLVIVLRFEFESSWRAHSGGGARLWVTVFSSSANTRLCPQVCSNKPQKRGSSLKCGCSLKWLVMCWCTCGVLVVKLLATISQETTFSSSNARGFWYTKYSSPMVWEVRSTVINEQRWRFVLNCMWSNRCQCRIDSYYSERRWSTLTMTRFAIEVG